jgi:cytidylate kinase
MRRMNVAFAGLTAAGKTTHAHRLADQLGYQYVSATGIMLGILGVDAPSAGVWFEHSEQIRAARSGDWADEELDRRLEELARTREGTVFDSWALAWVSPSPMVRVWIESDLPSRVRKCFVSQHQTSLTIDECARLVRDKDQEARAGFQRRFGFDLFTDRDRYDALLCNTHLIQRADAACAASGIETFAPVVLDVVTALMEHDAPPMATAAHAREILDIQSWARMTGGVPPTGRPTLWPGRTSVRN